MLLIDCNLVLDGLKKLETRLDIEKNWPGTNVQDNSGGDTTLSREKK
jgi:hypothetical protein